MRTTRNGADLTTDEIVPAELVRHPHVLHPIAEPGTPEELRRGIGVADLAASLVENREPRASAALALHVTEALGAIQLASDSRSTMRLTTTCDRPEPLSAAELERWDAHRDAA